MRLKGKIERFRSAKYLFTVKLEHIREYTGSIRQVISRLQTLTGRIEITDIWIVVLTAAKKLFVKRKADLTTAQGKGILADSNEVREEKEAQASFAPPKDIAVNSEFKVGKYAPLAWLKTSPMSVNHPVKGAISAKLVALFRAAMYYVRNIRIPIVAPLESAKGVIAESKNNVPTQYNSQAETAEGKSAESINNIPFAVTASGITAETNATLAEKEANPAVVAPAVAADSSGVVFCVAPKINHTAKPAMWADSVFVDGELYIRSAYSATQTDTILEVT